MSDTLTVTEQPIQVTVEAGDTVEVTEEVTTVVVSADGGVTVLEQPTTVTVEIADSITVTETPIVVTVSEGGSGGGGGPHKSAHVTGGGDALVKGDILAAAARYLETGSDPSADVARFWLNGALLKYYDDDGDAILQTVQRRGDVIIDGEHGARGERLHADSHDQSHALSDGDNHLGAISDAQHPVIGSGNHHTEYGRKAAAETISAVWTFSALKKSNPPKDSGTATSVAASSVTDTGKAWVVNQWAGGRVTINGRTRTISSNTATVLSVGTFPTDSGTDIADSDFDQTSTDTTLTPVPAEAWTVNQWIGHEVTCNGKTMIVTSNTATTLTGASWSGGGNPGNGNEWLINVTTTNTTLIDGREAWVVNEWAGHVVTCNSKTMTVTSNTARTLTGASWSGGGNPGNGFSWSIAMGVGAYTVMPGQVYDVFVGSETQPQARLGTDGVGFGTGTAAPQFITRRSTGLVSGIAANSGWEFHRSTAVVPRLFGTRAADTQPQWIWGAATAAGSTAGFALGQGGAVAPDTSMERSAAGVFRVVSHLNPDAVRLPKIAAPNVGGAFDGTVLYCRGATGGFPRLFYQDTTNREIGPLGTLHNIFGAPNFLFGQFAVMGQPDDDSAPGLAGVAATGLLANPALVGTATTVPLSWFENGSSLPFFEISTSGALNAVAGLYWPLHTIIQADPAMAVQFQFGLKDSGTVTSGTPTTVTDTTKAWVVNEWAGGQIKVVLTGGNYEFRTIASNTATVITVSSNFSDTFSGPYSLVGPKEANGRLFIGWSDQTLATMVGSDDPPGNYIGLQYSSTRSSGAGTADAAVTTTDTTLTDTREAWEPQLLVGCLVTCNGKTMTVASNTATTLTGAAWSGGGNPGNGFAWTLTRDITWKFVSKDGTTQNLVDTGSVATAAPKILRMIFDHDVGMTMQLYIAGWGEALSATILNADPIPVAGTSMRLIAGFQALAASVKKLRIQFINEVSGF